MKKMRLPRLITFFLASLLTAASAAEEIITVVSWGGVYEQAQRRAIFAPFTKATGISVKSITYTGGIDTIKDRAEAEKWDVIDMIEDQAISACDIGLLEPISANHVTSADKSMPLDDDFMPNAFRECSVAQNIYSTVYAYDDRVFLGEKPETIADFFDLEKFPGKRALLKDPDVILEWALIAIGVPVGQVYDLLSTDRGLRLAFSKLDSIRDSIVWWSDVGDPGELLDSGTVVMSSGYNGRFFSAMQEEKMPITIVWDGQVINYDVWSIANSSAKKDIAKKFLQFATMPAQMASMAEFIPYGPTRKSALSRIGLHEKSGVPMRDHLPNSTKNVDRALFGDSLWYARTKSLRDQRFENWLNETQKPETKTE